MLRIETDNPQIERLFEKVLTKVLENLGIDNKPIVLPPLDIPKIQPVQTLLRLDQNDKVLVEEVEEVEEPAKAPKTQKNRLKPEDRCAEGFPESWKKKIQDRISARTAFFIRDILEENHSAGYGQLVRNYVYGLDNVIYERLHTVKGSPVLVIPFWEENGVTKFAKNAYKLQSRLVQAAKDPSKIQELQLTEQETRQLSDLGIEF